MQALFQIKRTPDSFSPLAIHSLVPTVLLIGLSFVTNNVLAGTDTSIKTTSCVSSVNNGVEENNNEQWISTGSFEMGSDQGYSNEAPVHTRDINSFWIDRTEVSNNMFAKFIEATGYTTTAETTQTVLDHNGQEIDIPPGSAVFSSPTHLTTGYYTDWWSFVEKANWKHPEGPGSNIDGKENYPVIHVSHIDAKAYARWAKRELPTEAEWEFVADLYEQKKSKLANNKDKLTANTWQGNFPITDTANDGYAGIAPTAAYVGCQQEVYDMIGNVWEWVADEYTTSHFGFSLPADTLHPQISSDAEMYVIKGGSFLCAEDFCYRSRSAARLGINQYETSNHVGFRTIRRAQQ